MLGACRAFRLTGPTTDAELEGYSEPRTARRVAASTSQGAMPSTTDQATRLLEHPVVAEARRIVFEEDDETLRIQVELTEIPAPPFGEGPRAERVARYFEEMGLADVRRDGVGNVIADAPGLAERTGLVVSAHLDTVFAPGTDVRVRKEENRWVGPGISDDGRGLAALLTVARAVCRSGVPLRESVRFVATVGEEGAGDLRGAKNLFDENAGAASSTRGFISLDGAGLGRLVTRGLGVRRLRLTVQGPGGHSWADRDAPNPIHALAHAVAEMDRLSLPGDPPVGLTVARWGGGSSINAVPRKAWIEIDLRSESGNHLRGVEERVRKIAGGALGSANAGSGDGTGTLTLSVDVIGDRPAGATDPDHALVQAAIDATRSLGAVPELVASSTDSNIPMSLGIPAITMGAGGEAGQAHTPDEWFSNQRGPEGILRALLTVLLFVGVEGS